MDMQTRWMRAGLATVVPFLGNLGLTQIGIFQIMGEAGREAAAGENGFAVFDPSFADFAPIITVLYALSALVIILIALGASQVTRWGALILSGLLLLANGAHIIEHVMGADYWGAGLIVIAAVVPYAIAIKLLLGATPAAE